MEGQITLDQWSQWKEEIRRKLQETAENFVFLGYRMKQIRDTKAYEQDGCSSITEWAMKEYGLDKSSVSRFISINEKFSEGGNSLIMRKEFSGLGSSKLTEMLHLPEEDYNLISQKTSAEDIRDIKRFNKQEPDNDETQAQELLPYTPLQKCIIDYFSDSSRHDMLNNIIKMLWDEVPDYLKKCSQEMNPTEHGTHKKGIIFLFMYDYSTGVKVKTFGKEEIESISWKDFLSMVFEMYSKAVQDPMDTDFWCEYYGPLPEIKAEPVKQEEKQEKKPVQKTPEKPKSKTVDKSPTFSKNAELRASQLEEDEVENDEDEDKEDQDDLDTEEGETDDETDTQEENHQDSMEETFQDVLNPPEEDTELEDNTEPVAAVLENSDIEGYIPIIPSENLDNVDITLELLNEEPTEAELEEPKKDLEDLIEDMEYESEVLWKKVINWKLEKLSLKDLTETDEQLQKIRDILYEIMEVRK